VQRSRRAFALAEQYQDSEYGDQFTEEHFAILYEIFKSDVFKEIHEWLGWSGEKLRAIDKGNSAVFFALLSKVPDSLKAGEYLEPALTKSNDLIWLLPVIEDNEALNILIKTHDLMLAHATSKAIVQERQDAAIKLVSNTISFLSQVDKFSELEQMLEKLQSIVFNNKLITLAGMEKTQILCTNAGEHFSELRIKSYKKIQDLTLKKISKINLLAGLNNSGKTTLLEAIYLLVRQNDVGGLLEVIRNRGKIPEDHINMKWLVEQLTNNIEVTGTFDQQETRVSIRRYDENSTDLNKSRYLASIEITAKFGHTQQRSMTHLFKGRDRDTRAESIKLLSQVVYSSPFFLNEPQHYAIYYYKSVQSKVLPKILSFIRQYVVPSVSDIRLVDDLQRFLVNDSQFKEAQDLANYGEGLQRIFFLSLLFAAAQDGVLLIDEFENAIHTELIGKFAPFVHQLAVEFNVQVFMTSHSKECIDAFVKNVPEVDDFTFHTLLTDDNNRVVVREYDGKKFSRLLEIGDIDLRRMR
jgi:AAA15 family ATPase/GTPase